MSPTTRRWPRLAAVGLTTGVLAICTHTRADPAPPYRDLLRQAQTTSPRLAEGEAGIRRAEGLADQAAVRPNPTAGLLVESFGGSGPRSGLSGSETTLQVDQPFELGGKRPARIAVGRADVAAARARQVQVQADFAFDLADAYARAEAAERRLALAVEALDLAEEDARVARALVEAGREADLRSVQVQAAASSARADIEQRRAEREGALARLTALSGSPVPLTSIPDGLLDRAPSGAPPVADVLSTPAYLAAQAEREAAARRVRLERTRAAPDLTASFGVRRFGDDRSTAFVAGISAPLPIFDRNRGATAAARAELDAAEARLTAARLDAEASLRADAAQTQAAASRVTAARQAEQAADEAYRLTRLGYEGGKLSQLEVLNARRTLAESRARTLDAQLDRLTAEAALARLQGRTPFGDQP
ncbi:MAG TPA: TolC family protein [Caulobacteraceae bacterium]|jgi:cobalt-zinc-cadmium efflux system outer membrane protein|nr:TolC family protein [Caulobacteraceae bacterium]